MSSLAFLRKNFDDYAERLSFSASPEIIKAGLVLGYGTVLARLAGNRRGETMLALDLDEERILALLSAVCGRQISPKVMHHVRRASDQLRRGDKCLAQIELAFARFPRLEGREDAFRLFLAEDLLANGFTPRRLTQELGFDPGLLKYDPNQPRVPAGNGRASGEWGDGSSNGRGPGKAKDRPSGTTIKPASVAIAAGATAEGGTLASGLFTAEEATTFLISLGTFAATVGSAAALGSIIVLSDSHDVLQGTLPGDDDLHYRFAPANDAIAQFWREGPSGREPAFAARIVGDILYETETGVPIARLVGKALVFDAESLANIPELARSETKTETRVEEAAEQPQLCPDPGPDVPHGASVRSIVYQAYISLLNNPQRPLPPGMAVSLINPDTGRRVVFDDCREADGAMIEAKGQGFAKFTKYKYMKDVISKRWLGQGRRQVSAAGWRSNEWFFAEPEARDFAEKLFGDNKLSKILSIYVPPPID